MSGEWHPRKGCRLMATWPVDQDPPAGWQRSEFTLPLIWHIADGGPADEAVPLDGYTTTADCGVSKDQIDQQANDGCKDKPGC